MTVQYFLREEAAELDRAIERVNDDIEDAEKRIVELRARRDTLRFHRSEMWAAASFLDNAGFEVEQGPGPGVTVRVNQQDSA